MLAPLLAIALVVGGAGTAVAGGGDNVVLALNQTDGRHHALSGTVVTIAASDEVDSENLATARSHCEDCRTVAVAVQAVVITSEASTVTPKNVAAAVNDGCVRCATGAFAYQYVVSPGVPVRLSERGRAEIQQIRAEIAEAARSGLPFAELDARLDTLVARFKQVIDEEIQAAGGRAGGSLHDSVDLD